MTPLESVVPDPVTERPPFATSPHEMSLNFVCLSVAMAFGPTENVRSGHLPLTFITVPENVLVSPPGGGGGGGDGDGDGEGVGVGGGGGDVPAAAS